MDFVEIEEEVEVDLNSPECIEAIHSLKTSFKPRWTGKQLQDYYESRQLTEIQHRAVIEAKAKEYAAMDPDKLSEFIKSGEVERKMPNNLWDIVEQLHPVKVPLDEVFQKLNDLFAQKTLASKFWSFFGYPTQSKTNCALRGGWAMHVNETHTGIYAIDIRNLWNTISKFIGRESASDAVAQLLYKKITTE